MAKHLPNLTFKQQVHEFFENPKGLWALIIHYTLIGMIIFSVIAVGYEHFFPHIPDETDLLLNQMEWIILVSFTVEYILRFWASPSSKLKFTLNPYNIIDLLAIVPSYIAFSLNAFPYAASLRILRFARVLRLLKFIRYTQSSGVFQFKKTILQVILPVIIGFTILKLGIVYLEFNNLWLDNLQLGDLFGIVGFALGIIISQKIGVAHDKLITVEIGTAEVASITEAMMETMNNTKKNSGTIMIQWLEHYYDLLKRGGNRRFFDKTHSDLMKTIFRVTTKDHAVRESLCDSYVLISQKAHVVLNRMDNRIPKAYDVLLHQSVLIYCLLLTLFIPGFAGVISVMIATYILYGMYQVTNDMDLAIADKTMNLITADISDMQNMLRRLKN
jgi:hypothetical protein